MNYSIKHYALDGDSFPYQEREIGENVVGDGSAEMRKIGTDTVIEMDVTDIEGWAYSELWVNGEKVDTMDPGESGDRRFVTCKIEMSS